MIEVKGYNAFNDLSKACDSAARDFAREFSKAAVDALKPLPRELDEAIDQTMPRRGGYANKVRQNAKRVVRLQAGGRFSLIGRRDFRQLDRGILRHPLFGDQDRWYQQRIRPGFWSKTVGHASIGAEQRMKAALRRLVSQIDRAA